MAKYSFSVGASVKVQHTRELEVVGKVAGLDAGGYKVEVAIKDVSPDYTGDDKTFIFAPFNTVKEA